MSLFQPSFIQVFDDDGNPINGAKWKFYITQTSTPLNVYSDPGLGSSLGAVVVSDSAGRFQEIFLNAAYGYRTVLTDASDVTILDIDPYTEAVAGSNSVGTVAELKALAANVYDIMYLTDPLRYGMFVWQVGDYTDEVAADPLNGIYVPADSDSSGAAGVWIRDWDGIHAQVEWFGAIKNDVGSATTNVAAIQAALDLVPVTMLGGGDYYTDAGLTITINGTELRGAAHTQGDQAVHDGDFRKTTQIICTSASATIIRIGDSNTSYPGTFVESVKLTDFTVTRNINPYTPASGFIGSIGIDCRWMVNSHMTRVFSKNSCLCWRFYGTVENYVNWCGALREREGSDAGNDVFVGFYLDYAAPAPFNGGNASLYFSYCRVFPGDGLGTPALTYSAGWRSSGGFVDLWLDNCETGGMNHGFHGIGAGVGDFHDEDLFIRDSVFDACAETCVQIENGGNLTQVTITGCYLAPLATATALFVGTVGGNVTISNNQFVTATPGTATGVSIIDSVLSSCRGNSYTNFRQPIIVDACHFATISDESIHTTDTTVKDHPAITVANASANIYISGISISGPSDCYTAGVYVNSLAAAIEVAGVTSMELGAVATGGKVSNNGTPITAAGTFGTNCLASGIFV